MIMEDTWEVVMPNTWKKQGFKGTALAVKMAVWNIKPLFYRAGIG